MSRNSPGCVAEIRPCVGTGCWWPRNGITASSENQLLVPGLCLGTHWIKAPPYSDFQAIQQANADDTAILDRFLHRAELIQITCKSYRLERADHRSDRHADRRLEKPEKNPNSTKAPTGSAAEK